TELWWMPVATQNKITRSCALSFVVGFSIIYSTSKQRQPQHAASDSSPAARSIRPSAEHFQQWAALASAGCIRWMARGSGRYRVPSAHENWSLVHKGVVVDLVNHEIRHVGARDEPAPPVARIDQGAIGVRLRAIGQDHGPHDLPVELAIADDAFLHILVVVD